MGSSRPWSDLPPELLADIVNSLVSSPLYIHQFRSVCKSWSLAISPLHNNISSLFPVSYNYSTFSVSSVYLIRPSLSDSYSIVPRNWLLFTDQSNLGKIRIQVPFSRCNYMPDNGKRLNLLDVNISELSRHVNVSELSQHLSFLFPHPYKFLKVLFSESESGSGMFMLVFNGSLWFATFNRLISLHYPLHFDDIIDYNGKILGIDRLGRVYELSFSLSSPPSLILHEISGGGGGGMRKRLIKSLGVLYLVVRCFVPAKTEGTDKFEVYILDQQTSKWVFHKDTNDQTFFFGVDFSFAVSTRDLGISCMTNSIIFGEHSFKRYNGEDSDAMLLTKLVAQEDLRVGIFRFEVDTVIRAIQSDIGCSSILWPPPSWIVSD